MHTHQHAIILVSAQMLPVVALFPGLPHCDRLWYTSDQKLDVGSLGNEASCRFPIINWEQECVESG